MKGYCSTINIQNYIIKFIIICSFLISFSIFAIEPIYTIQNMDLLNEMSSSISGDWNITDEKVDPRAYSKMILNDEQDLIIWKPYSVPGNISQFYTTPFSPGFKVYIKKEFILPQNWNNSQFSILFRRISDRDRTYLNGELIGSTGNFGSKDPEAVYQSRIYDIPENILRKGKKNLLLVEVEPFFDDRGGILVNEIKLGPSSLLYRSFHTTEGIKVFIGLIYFFIGIIFIYIFLFRKDKKEYLFYSLFNIFFSIQQIFISQKIYDHFYNKFIIWHLPYIVLPPVFLFFAHFIRLYYKRSYYLFHKIIDILLVLLIGSLMYFNDLKIDLIIWKNILVPIFIFYLIYSTFILIQLFFQKNSDAKYMLIAMSISLPSITLDFFGNLGYVIIPQMASPFFILLFDISLALILSIHIEKVRKDIKDLNTNLEQKVNQRTLELQKTLEQLKNLKIKEDNLHYFISYKLKNSVDEINNLTQLLLQSEFIENNDRSSVLDNLYYESNELFLTLQKLISWTMIQKNQEFGDYTNFSISESLSTEFNFYKDLATRRDIQFNLNFHDYKLSTNLEKLIFIIRELLSNAIKFSNKNGIIDLNIYVVNNNLIFNIKDRGIGIKNEYIEKLSKNLFELISEDPETVIPLGLSICKIFLDSIHGNFQIRSSTDSGTEIQFSIPMN